MIVIESIQMNDNKIRCGGAGEQDAWLPRYSLFRLACFDCSNVNQFNRDFIEHIFIASTLICECEAEDKSHHFPPALK